MDQNPQTNQQMNSSKAPKIIGAVLAIAVVAGGIGWFAKRDTQKVSTTVPESSVPDTTPVATVQPVATNDAPPTSEQTNQPPATEPAKEEYTYVDGTYTAIGNYESPGGDESIKVTLTLKDDVITSASTVSNATRPNSVTFQGIFVAGFKPLVAGKKIQDVNLTKVSGSSLTPRGFNDAVAKIKVQAT